MTDCGGKLFALCDDGVVKGYWLNGPEVVVNEKGRFEPFCTNKIDISKISYINRSYGTPGQWMFTSI